MGHIWLSGQNASDHDLLPELRKAREARAKLKHAILAVSLKTRLEHLKRDEADSEDEMGDIDLGSVGGQDPCSSRGERPTASLKHKMKGTSFHEVVMASMRDQKQKQEALEADQELEAEASRRSFQGA